MPEFVLPGPDKHTVVMGANGTGKTVLGAWVLSKQDMRKRPWVILDFKDEEIWDHVEPRRLRLGEFPFGHAKSGAHGLYIMRVLPGQEEQLEAWLWKVWKRGNIGLFCDEATFLTGMNSCKAILRQGRSKLIPMIACTQRPIGIDREFFTESKYKAVFRLDDDRDYKIIRGFTRNANVEPVLPKHCCYWYDSNQAHLFRLRPTPSPATIAADLRSASGARPVTLFLG
jgi:hypothetical protein